MRRAKRRSATPCPTRSRSAGSTPCWCSAARRIEGRSGSSVGWAKARGTKNLVALSSRAFAHAVRPGGRTAWAKARTGHCFMHAVPRAFAHPADCPMRVIRGILAATHRQGDTQLIIEWHTHVYPPEEAAASPMWGGRCPMTVENVLDAHHKAGLAV